MTKLIAFLVLISFAHAQTSEEITLDDAAEEFSSVLPRSDEPIESDAVAGDPVDDTLTEPLTNESRGEEILTEAPEANPETPPEEIVDATEESLSTPNPLAEKSQPREEPVADLGPTPSPETSTPVISTRAPRDPRFIDHRASHWITTFGFEGMKYEVPYDFEGARKNFRDRDQELYGGRVGVGGQLHLFAGFFTTTMVEAFYVGTLTRSIDLARPEVDEEAGSFKRTGGLWGGEVSQNLGYIFEFRTKNPFMDEWAYLTFEPFVEAGLGVARAYNAVTYNYDTGPAVGSGEVREQYKRRIRDELTNARVGAGFNLTGRSGFFMTAKATINRYDITNRKIDSYTQQDDQAGANGPKIRLDDVKIDPITVFSIGGGYKF